ncbi:hypothetical protein BP5796_07589 [Coleophoma crateriformis]|uniref:Transmembrane protein n=1 Tax=Coleophoma crateriformis TaxID=565419 RepID=A0A3D8RJC1_9HELO|nr:hypothetical protein BP5796_07589 [Coleophoma crateriformis]
MSEPQPAPPGSSLPGELPKRPATPPAAVLVDHLERGELYSPRQPRAAESYTLSSWFRQLRAPPPSPSSEYAAEIHAAPAVDSATPSWSRPSSALSSLVSEDSTPAQEITEEEHKRTNRICAFVFVTFFIGMIFLAYVIHVASYEDSGDSGASNDTQSSNGGYYPLAGRNA